jgi:hypothetical protein
MSSEGAEVNVLLRGPGIEGVGRRYIFANTDRCASFVEAVNFAYRQGLHDGRARNRAAADGLLIVSGRCPEDLRLRRETWRERLWRILREAASAR